METSRAGTIAAGVVLSFIESTQKIHLEHLQPVRWYSARDYLGLDLTTRRDLELTRTMREGKREGSLLGVIDCCMTPMGRRLLRSWLEEPLVDPVVINQRLDAVEELLASMMLRESLRQQLDSVYDLERLVARVEVVWLSPVSCWP